MSRERLERRYARWTALFYPVDYRRERGSELVDTYLSLVAPTRGRPSFGDVADLAAGGLRQHLRTAQRLRPGFRLAGLLALTTATVFATWWTGFEVLAPIPPWSSRFGPFLSLAVVAWAAWLLAAAVALLIGTLLIAFGLAARRDFRGAWATLILLTPIGMLAVNPLGAVLDTDSGPGRAVIPEWSSMVLASVLVVTAGPMLVSLALVARGRWSPDHRGR